MSRFEIIPPNTQAESNQRFEIQTPVQQQPQATAQNVPMGNLERMAMGLFNSEQQEALNTLDPLDRARMVGQSTNLPWQARGAFEGVPPRVTPEQLSKISQIDPMFTQNLPTAIQDPAALGIDMAGATAGAALGSRVFKNPLGTILGAAGGSIAGGTAAKQLNQALGLEPEESVLSSGLEATGEELVGRAIGAGLGGAGRLAQAVAPPLVEQASKLARKLNLPIDNIDIKKTFLTSTDIDPADLTARSITEAQENLFNERLLTSFEESGGKLARSRFADLVKTIENTAGLTTQKSAFFQTRDKINSNLNKVIGNIKGKAGLEGIEKTQGAATTALQKSMVARLNAFKEPFGKLEKELVKLRKTAEVPVQPLSEALSGIRQEAIEVKGDVANKIFKEIDKLLPTEGNVTLAQLNRIEKNIKNTIGKFAPTKDSQTELAGYYSAKIKPIFDDVKIQAAQTAPVDSDLVKALAAEVQFNKLAKERGNILNSKVGRALGLTETKQGTKAMKPEAVERVIFSSPQAWRQTKDILQEVNPALIKTFENRFQGRLLVDSYDNKLGEVTFDKLQKAIDKYGEDVIISIGGQKYFDNLQDAALITRGMRESLPLQAMRQGVELKSDVMKNTVQAIALPLMRNRAFMSVISSGARKAIGLGEVTDKMLFKALQGENGERLMMRLNNNVFNSPATYNILTDLVREINKFDKSIEPPSETTINGLIEQMNAIGNELSTIGE